MSDSPKETYSGGMYERLISFGLPQVNPEEHNDAMRELCETRLEANRLGCAIALLVVSTGFIADLFYYPEESGIFAAIRIPSLIVLAVLWLVQGRWNSKRWQYLPLTVFVFGSSISWIVSLMIWYLDGANSPYFAGYMLVLMGMSFVMRVSPLEAAAYGIYMVTQYIFAVWAHENNLWGFALNVPDDAQASLITLMQAHPLFPLGVFFIVLAILLCTIGAVLITSESFSRLLEKANAKRAREDLMRFVAMASHEIKTPVQYLLTFSEHLMKSPAVSADPDFAIIQMGMEQQTNRLLNELQQLSEVSRLESRGSIISAEDSTACCSLSSVLTSVVSNVEAACQITGIHLETDALEERVFVRGTLEDLTLILNNVINNAVKFTEVGGRIVISTNLVNDTQVKAPSGRIVGTT